MLAIKWRKGERKPRDPEEVARAIVIKNPRLVAQKVAWQKQRFAEFSQAGPRASAKEQERLRGRMAVEMAAAGRRPELKVRKGRV
jgi:hypothetical protein